MRSALRLSAGGTLLLLALLAAACQPGSGGEEAGVDVARIPFACGESSRYALREIDGTPVAEADFEVLCEGGALLLEQSFRPGAGSDGGAGHDRSRVVVDRATLLPLESIRRAAREGEETSWSAAYAGDPPRVVFVEEAGGERSERELRLRQDAYDNESALWLWRTLDLSEGYDARYVSVSAVTQRQITVRLTVAREERIEVPAGAFDVWRLQVRSGRATRVAWVAVEAPHQLVQWDNGSEIFRLLSYDAGSPE